MHPDDESGAARGEMPQAHEPGGSDRRAPRIRKANDAHLHRRVHPSALVVVDAVSRHLGQSASDLPAFFGRLSETIAGLVGARRAAFWRLEPDNTMVVQPEPFGFAPGTLESLSVPLDPSGTSFADRVVFQDRVHVGILDPVELAEYRAVLDAMSVRNAVAVSWRAGDRILGGLAAYDADQDFDEHDVWVLRVAARTAGLVWHCEEAHAAQDRLSTELVAVAEAERSRIASDIHDEALQNLTAAELSLRRLRQRAGHLDGLSELATSAATLLRRTDDSLRRLVFDIRPPVPRRPDALERAVEARVRFLRLSTGIACRTEVTMAQRVSPKTADAAFRIIHAALNNVARHSHARHGLVRISADDSGVAIVVNDDGCGFEPDRHEPRPGHIGLASVRLTAESLGGWATVRSGLREGTTVEAWLPLHPSATDTRAQRT